MGAAGPVCPVRSRLSCADCAQPGLNGNIIIDNTGTDSVDVVLDLSGWYANSTGPVQNGQTLTSRYMPVQGVYTGAPWVSYEYRSGSTGAFASIPVSAVTLSGTFTNPSAWPVTVNGSSQFDAYVWDMPATVGVSDQLVQIRACYGVTATDATPVCSLPVTEQLAVNGFQTVYAATDLGPGSLSEMTGDYSISAVDANVPDYQGSLAVSRTLTTRQPAGERAGATGIFGPSWTSSLDVPQGDAALTVADHSAQGYFTFTGPDGEVSTYQAPSGSGSYPKTYLAVGATAAAGTTVKQPTATTLTMADVGGTVTTWSKSGSTWKLLSVADPTGTMDAYSYDGNLRPTSVVGVVPLGMTCAAPTTTRGCRSLSFAYTTVTVAGATLTRLSGISLTAWDPSLGTPAMATTQIAAYSYDSSGRLYQEWDPRISPALKTTYTYDSNGRLSALTPPGQAAWTYTYNASGQLSSLTRPDPSSVTATWTVVYGVPISGTAAPIDLAPATTATWGQTSVLIGGAAVFGPNRVPAGTTADTVSPADWLYGTIDYLDVNGQPVNHATYGAGAWQYDATAYGPVGLASRSLTAANRAQAISPTTYTDPAVAAMPTSAQRAGALSTETLYDPVNPGRITSASGPVHPVILINGTRVDGSHVTSYTYDEGNPNDGTTLIGLPTTTTDAVAAADGTHDLITNHSGYAPIYAGDSSGWTFGEPTTVTVQMGGSPSSADLVTTTRYNILGQPMETRLPGGAAGSTANPRLSATTAQPVPAAAWRPTRPARSAPPHRIPSPPGKPSPP